MAVGVLDRLLPTTRGATDPSTATHGTDLELSAVHDLLKEPRRRFVLDALDEQDTWTIAELAEELAAEENDISVRDVTSAQRKRTYVGLYQSHLDQLADNDVITYDKPRGYIQRGPEYDAIRAIQTATQEVVA